MTHQGQPKFATPMPVAAHEVPPTSVRASIWKPKRSHMVTVTSIGSSLSLPTTPPTPTTLATALAALPPEAPWALRCLNIQDDGRAVAEAIKQGSAVAGSDGSLKLGLGTSAFAFQRQDGTIAVDGANMVLRPVKEGESHHPEMTGLYALVLLLQTICSFHEI